MTIDGPAAASEWLRENAPMPLRASSGELVTAVGSRFVIEPEEGKGADDDISGGTFRHEFAGRSFEPVCVGEWA